MTGQLNVDFKVVERPVSYFLTLKSANDQKVVKKLKIQKMTQKSKNDSRFEKWLLSHGRKLTHISRESAHHSRYITQRYMCLHSILRACTRKVDVSRQFPQEVVQSPVFERSKRRSFHTTWLLRHKIPRCHNSLHLVIFRLPKHLWCELLLLPHDRQAILCTFLDS